MAIEGYCEISVLLSIHTVNLKISWKTAG